MNNENIEGNNENIIKEPNENIFTSYIGTLGWIAYISSFDNNSKIKKNIDFFSDDYNKTLFVMEYIRNRDGSNNFINIVNDEYPAYGIDLYLYDDFNVEYFEMFSENYTKDAKIIDDKKYVVYSNRHHGSNGVYAENINIIDVIKEDDNYIATIELFYSEYTNIDKINATIKYKKNGDKITFKSFVVN